MKTNIIGINGRINHGKDEVAKIIQYLTFINSRKEFNNYCTYDHFKDSSLTMMSLWQVKKMAYKLKQIASILLNVPVAKPNEYESVKDRNGIVIKVVRDIEIPKHEHESETALDSYRFDYVINNNKDINHLISEVETLLKDLKII